MNCIFIPDNVSCHPWKTFVNTSIHEHTRLISIINHHFHIPTVCTSIRFEILPISIASIISPKAPLYVTRPSALLSFSCPCLDYEYLVIFVLGINNNISIQYAHIAAPNTRVRAALDPCVGVAVWASSGLWFATLVENPFNTPIRTSLHLQI